MVSLCNNLGKFIKNLELLDSYIWIKNEILFLLYLYLYHQMYLLFRQTSFFNRTGRTLNIADSMIKKIDK